MKITKDYEGLVRIENGDYVLSEDLISNDNIEINLDDRFVVNGKINTTKSIISNVTVMVSCGIEAGEGIEAGCGIEAKSFIKAEKRIFAGTSVYRTNDDCDKTIKCAELQKGDICFGELVITQQEIVMTISEIEAKLGIKNLKIKED